MDSDIRSIYIGNLPPKTADRDLFEIFSHAGFRVVSCKIIRPQDARTVYGFIDFESNEEAGRALQMFAGRKIFDNEVKVNWAHNTSKEDSALSRIFVGDLSSEVDEKALREAFSVFPSCVNARVIIDPNTNRSRGYGFVSFRNREDAEQAISSMNGSWIGSRSIRCNWATRSSDHGSDAKNRSVDFQEVSSQSSPTNTVIYIGNLTPNISEEILRSSFERFGRIVEVKINAKGYGFLTFDNHEKAAKAISTMNGTELGGSIIKCAWGTGGKQSMVPIQQYQPQYFPQQYIQMPQQGFIQHPYLAQMGYAYPFSHGVPDAYGGFGMDARFPNVDYSQYRQRNDNNQY